MAKQLTISKEDFSEIQDDIKKLNELLTDRISDLHDVKGGMQARHAYLLYRDRLWEIRDKLNKGLTLTK